MIAIIPARGGSKGLPGKNVRPLGGIPLIAHSIQTALKAQLVSRVIVSTDDDEIGAVAKEYGAEFYKRPAELADDNSMVMDAYFNLVDQIAEQTGAPVKSFIALLPTAPLRLALDIDNAIEIFNRQKADSVISVTESPVPIQWYRKIKPSGVLCDYSPDFNAVINRQALEQTYIPNGAIFIFRTEILRRTREYYTEYTYPYLMPRSRSVDIDELLDFEWAEMLLSKSSTHERLNE